MLTGSSTVCKLIDSKLHVVVLKRSTDVEASDEKRYVPKPRVARYIRRKSVQLLQSAFLHIDVINTIKR